MLKISLTVLTLHPTLTVLTLHPTQVASNTSLLVGLIKKILLMFGQYHFQNTFQCFGHKNPYKENREECVLALYFFLPMHFHNIPFGHFLYIKRNSTDCIADANILLGHFLKNRDYLNHSTVLPYVTC